MAIFTPTSIYLNWSARKLTVHQNLSLDNILSRFRTSFYAWYVHVLIIILTCYNLTQGHRITLANNERKLIVMLYRVPYQNGVTKSIRLPQLDISRTTYAITMRFGKVLDDDCSTILQIRKMIIFATVTERDYQIFEGGLPLNIW